MLIIIIQSNNDLNKFLSKWYEQFVTKKSIKNI